MRKKIVASVVHPCHNAMALVRVRHAVGRRVNCIAIGPTGPPSKRDRFDGRWCETIMITIIIIVTTANTSYLRS